MEVGLLIGGFIVLIVVIGAVSMHFDKKRTQAFEAVAASMNFTFSKDASLVILGAADSFHLFSQGHSKRVKNVMQGVAKGIDLKIFDYRYTVGHGKNSHTYTQTVILFTSDRLQLPAFTMRPENVFHKIGGAFGYQDIDFDRNPDFSKSYLLRGPDEDRIRDAFTKDVLSYFERQKGICVEAEGDTIAFYRSSKKVPPDGIGGILENGFAVFSLFAQAAPPAQAPQPDQPGEPGGVKIRMPT